MLPLPNPPPRAGEGAIVRCARPRRVDDALHRARAETHCRARLQPAVAGARPDGDRLGDGVFGVDRDRRGGPLHRPQRRLLPAAPRHLHRARRRCGRRRLPGADARMAAGGALPLRRRPAAAGGGADSRNRARGQRQPSELMKLLAVLYAADYTARKSAVMDDFKRGFLPMAAVMMLVGSLLLLEPDFGAFVVIVSIAMGILFLGGLNWKVFAALVAVLLAGFVTLILTSPYRMQRVLGFMDPFADPYGKGYQLSHALIAFGRGEWLGLGLGGSVEKMFYLPEAHTDFLLAVIAEECGFVGVTVVIGLFAWLIVKAFLIGHRAAQLERNYCALVAQGIGIWLGVQALINMGVNVGLLPTKGLTLPFLSFGGSGIIANCLAIAVLLRIDWEHRQMMRGKTF